MNPLVCYLFALFLTKLNICSCVWCYKAERKKGGKEMRATSGPTGLIVNAYLNHRTKEEEDKANSWENVWRNSLSFFTLWNGKEKPYSFRESQRVPNGINPKLNAPKTHINHSFINWAVSSLIWSKHVLLIHSDIDIVLLFVCKMFFSHSQGCGLSYL